MKEAILETRHLQKTYRSRGRENPVIRDLDLQLYAGSFTVIMGSSGSGKSTLLYLLSGLDQASAGQIRLRGISLTGKPEKALARLRREQLGFVFQNSNLVPNLTVLENILVAGYLGRESRKKVRTRALDLLEQTGLGDLAQRRPAQLSGGEQQRCAMVRALINRPAILLADEPTGSLNSAASQKILDLLSDLHQQGQTILMVTHDIRSACRGERILYFQDGQIIDEMDFDATASTIKSRERILSDWLVQKNW